MCRLSALLFIIACNKLSPFHKIRYAIWRGKLFKSSNLSIVDELRSDKSNVVCKGASNCYALLGAVKVLLFNHVQISYMYIVKINCVSFSVDP